ncbi:membrane or secreted protein [Allorhodopirellula heiligendammensis]|uniref:Uncharacterized protein n=1 Tax=Allorhodopirellula heiligendammensis TaxID=2714739 RepID=A0A5C6BSC6_9BACT|nr:membrane or secreted protein [Allorhodopirellula heiligendammensis]TWU15143.1 hypothetical protein Poly21_23350 [Allorhodopirellula heiligendammensis]
MMIQPGMALARASECGAKDCGATCASTDTCDGCGCCQVATPELKCSCCDVGERSADKNDCCREEADSDTPERISLSGGTLELKTIVISTAEPSLDTRLGIAIPNSTGDVDISSTCHCGVESSPLGEPAPTRPTIPPRDAVAIRHSDLADLFGGQHLPRRPRNDRGVDCVRPHFSQIQLCMWRL